MANVTWEDILNALVTKLDAAHAELTDRVFTRFRFVETDDVIQEAATVLQSLNSDGKPQGIILDWAGWTSDRQGNFCNLYQLEQFEGVFILPYNDNRSDGSTSTQVFREVIAACRSTLNTKASFDLGLGSDVQTNLMQAPTMTSRPFGVHSGDNAFDVHMLQFTISARVLINASLET